MALQTGIVKWFNDAKGFGFIKQDSGLDVFVHYSVIQAEGYRKLTEGQIVHYEKRDSAKGPCATTVLPTKCHEANIPPADQLLYLWQKVIGADFSAARRTMEEMM